MEKFTLGKPDIRVRASLGPSSAKFGVHRFLIEGALPGFLAGAVHSLAGVFDSYEVKDHPDEVRALLKWAYQGSSALGTLFVEQLEKLWSVVTKHGANACKSAIEAQVHSRLIDLDGDPSPDLEGLIKFTARNMADSVLAKNCIEKLIPRMDLPKFEDLIKELTAFNGAFAEWLRDKRSEAVRKRKAKLEHDVEEAERELKRIKATVGDAAEREEEAVARADEAPAPIVPCGSAAASAVVGGSAARADSPVETRDEPKSRSPAFRGSLRRHAFSGHRGPSPAPKAEPDPVESEPKRKRIARVIKKQPRVAVPETEAKPIVPKTEAKPAAPKTEAKPVLTKVEEKDIVPKVEMDFVVNTD